MPRKTPFVRRLLRRAAALAAAGLALPPAAGGATHPETTQRDHDGEPVELVHIRVIDKVENRQMRMRMPVGVTVPLPSSIHGLRVTRYTEDFTLDALRKQGSEGDGEAPPEAETSAPTEPVPRESGEANPAALIQLYRRGEPAGRTWIFRTHPYLFQPPSMRYTFVLLGAGDGPG